MIDAPRNQRLATYPSASCTKLILRCLASVEYASTAWTLEPGDLIATGTCGGVAAGMQPPRWLKVGDVVRMEVEGIGYLENRVVPEPPGTMGFID